MDNKTKQLCAKQLERFKAYVVEQCASCRMSKPVCHVFEDEDKQDVLFCVSFKSSGRSYNLFTYYKTCLKCDELNESYVGWCPPTFMQTFSLLSRSHNGIFDAMMYAKDIDGKTCLESI